ncbi:NUDIX domain-containing protein [Actinomycetospora endophytica]|uniref:NUDIX domain-containing protein n=1 Tax=Actinomycetospora endophytica TaxID=2291215 RepID=A0ABS8PE89_9PSEU|nr:NUDIX domain-containing protein [Actinomycetospora endophytica]MCD2196585.1 NUDIX domain-containing protein [Actinomycetospora endophytica]
MNLFGPGGWLAVLIVAVVVVVLLVTAAVMIGRARRLDRLHVRVDAAYHGLIDALDRRAAVVRAVAATAPPSSLTPTDRRALRTAARAVEGARGAEAREAAENDLVVRRTALDDALLPPDLSAELADADARVVVARRVHNDAIRDTRALRGRRMVRVLHLAGTAPWPRYFEIAEAGERPGDGDGAVDLPVARDAARVVVLDPDGRVLLFEGVDPARPGEAFWFTPGGGVEPDEDPADAAGRELGQETGIVAGKPGIGDLDGPLWVRDVIFDHDGVTYAAREVFFVLRVDPVPTVDVSGFTEQERRTVRRHRWWTRTELAATIDVVYPRQLADLLGDPGSLAPPDPPVPIQ